MSKKVLKMSKLDEIVFKSYQDVINKRMSAGKDVTNLTTRLNLLMSRQKTS